MAIFSRNSVLRFFLLAGLLLLPSLALLSCGSNPDDKTYQGIDVKRRVWSQMKGTLVSPSGSKITFGEEGRFQLKMVEHKTLEWYKDGDWVSLRYRGSDTIGRKSLPNVSVIDLAPVEVLCTAHFEGTINKVMLIDRKYSEKFSSELRYGLKQYPKAQYQAHLKYKSSKPAGSSVFRGLPESQDLQKFSQEAVKSLCESSMPNLPEEVETQYFVDRLEPKNLRFSGHWGPSYSYGSQSSLGFTDQGMRIWVPPGTQRVDISDEILPQLHTQFTDDSSLSEEEKLDFDREVAQGSRVLFTWDGSQQRLTAKKTPQMEQANEPKKGSENNLVPTDCRYDFSFRVNRVYALIDAPEKVGLVEFEVDSLQGKGPEYLGQWSRGDDGFGDCPRAFVELFLENTSGANGGKGKKLYVRPSINSNYYYSSGQAQQQTLIFLSSEGANEADSSRNYQSHDRFSVYSL